jgi:hypothetical protein
MARNLGLVEILLAQCQTMLNILGGLQSFIGDYLTLSGDDNPLHTAHDIHHTMGTPGVSWRSHDVLI